MSRARQIRFATMLVTFTGAVFCLFFQISKGYPFRDINPFLDDPYDAVGSIAVQVAFVVGALTFSRALRLREDSVRLILRGNMLVLAAAFTTLVGDAIAELARPLPQSYWGDVLVVELAVMFGLVLSGALVLAFVFRRQPTPPPPAQLTPADGLDDLWMLVRVPARKARRILPDPFVARIEGFQSDRVFAGLPWVSPRLHPWRFASAVGLMAGAAVVLAQSEEGLPPDAGRFLLLAGIFISGELVATLLGFAIFGRYLGLRPRVAALPR